MPIVAGGRLTGRTSIGLLNIQADDEPVSQSPDTNFTVVRLKRDVLRRSSVGAIYTGRSIAQSGIGRNAAYGVDAALGFFDNLTMIGYWAKTDTDGLAGDDQSHRLSLNYSGDRYGLQLERLSIGDNFNPEVGFLRRDDIRKHFALARFSPRPKTGIVRKYTWTAAVDHSTNGGGRLDLREYEAEFITDFQSGDKIWLSYSNFYEYLAAPFRIGPGVTLPSAAYDYQSLGLVLAFSARRPLSGSAVIESGSFYNGTKTMFSVTGGRVELTPRFSLQPTTSLNWIDLDEGAFKTTLVGSRVTFTATPLMFASALLQYNSSNKTAAANVRFRWEYQPGSELFVVFNEQRDTLGLGFPDLANRAFVVKINKLLRF